MTDTLGLNLPLVYEVVKSGELWDSVGLVCKNVNRCQKDCDMVTVNNKVKGSN